MLGSSCLAALSIAFASPAAAQGDGGALDAADFLARFVTTSSALAEIDAEAELSAADVTAAARWDDPTLSYAREALFPEGGGEAENTVALGWRLDLSGSRGRRARAARAALSADRARAADDKLAAKHAAMARFYRAASLAHQVRILRATRPSLARMVDAVAARATAGDASAYDRSRLELELAAHDQRTADVEAELTSANRVLAGLLGTPAVKVEARDPLDLPGPPADVATLARGALDARGDLRATEHASAAARAALGAARRRWVPRVDVELGLKTADLGAETATGYVASIGVTVPLFDRGQAEAERARAAARLARARRANLERAIPTGVHVAHRELSAAIERVQRFRAAQLEPATALVGKAEAVYQAGEASVVELVDAYRVARDAQLHELELRYQARLAALSLSRAVGRDPVAP